MRTVASFKGKQQTLGVLNGEEQLVQWSMAKNNQCESSWPHLVNGKLI